MPMRKIVKIKERERNACMACGKIGPGPWYRWMDLYFNPGTVIHERICKPCATREVGVKNKRLKEILDAKPI